MTDRKIIDVVDGLSKLVVGIDENSKKNFMEMCSFLSGKCNVLSVDSKLTVLNLFCNSFAKFGNRMSSFNSVDGILVTQTSIAMLSSLVANGDAIISSLHELVFLDLTSKIFNLLCKLIETIRQVPRNIGQSLLTTKALVFVGLPNYRLKMPDDVVTFTDDHKTGGGGRLAKSGGGGSNRPGSAGKVRKIRSMSFDPILSGLENMRLRGSGTVSDSPATNSPEAELSSLVRRNALNFLGLLLQNATPSSVVTAWPVLLSPNSDPSHPPRSVLSIILNDPSIPVRYMACSVVIELLDDSVKPFITVAQEQSSAIGNVPSAALPSSSTQSSSFTPYSMQLAILLREIHRRLNTAALSANTSGPSGKCPQMVVHSLKALKFLARITPYHRMRPGLLTDVYKVSAALLRSKDVDVRVACLTVFGEILGNSNAHQLAEMESLVRSAKPPSLSSMANSSSSMQSPPDSLSGTATPQSISAIHGAFLPTPWLFKVAMDSSAANSVYSYPVKIESLQLLNQLIKFYSVTIFFEARQLPELFKFVYKAFYAGDAVYVAHVCFVLETIGHKLNEAIEHGHFGDDSALIGDVVSFWSDTLSNHIFRLLQQPVADDNSSTQTAALLDALSSIGPFIFERLPANLRILCTTTPLDLAQTQPNDSLAICKSIRSSAVRCLGHLVSYSGVQKDTLFIQQCFEVAIQHSTSEPACQCAAAWLLRNAIGDDLATTTSFNNFEMINKLLITSDKTTKNATSLLDQVFSTSIRMTLKSPDKAKPHAMTVIWRVLMSLRPFEEISPSLKDLCSSAICDVICKVLVGSAKGPVKLQWNAADGIAAAFSSRHMYVWLLTLPMSPDAVTCLVNACCTAIARSPNFKTRTTLALGLRHFAFLLENDEETGRFCFKCLSCFFEAFSTARCNIKSPTEFKHVDGLVASIWLGFVVWLSRAPEAIITTWLEQFSSADGLDKLDTVIHDVKASLHSEQAVIDCGSKEFSACTKAVDRLDTLETSKVAAVKFLSDSIKAYVELQQMNK